MSREMLVMFGLLLLMLQMISCVDQTCRFNQTEICYAALGHKLSLQMVPDSQHYDATLKHHKTGDTTVDPTSPIGSVKVSVNCTSGERRVFCSSDGDELIFSWTLNGLPQTEGNDSIGLDDETSGNISCGVKNHVSHGEKSIPLNYCTGSTTVSVTSALTNSTPASAHGTSLSDSNLTCTQTSEELSSLWKFLPVGLIVLGCVTGILVVLFITVYHIYKRKKHRKSTAAAQVCVELIYADINHMKPNRDNRVKKADMSPAVDVEYAAVGPQTKRKERKEMKDEELQYGEVTFTPDGSNIQQQQQRRCEEQDECVYSQIQTHKLKH
ncbi:uncharacterized protein LOC130549808 isoform X5 [Triplophysa rosa]|uniref:uncharacterized protein LOC130549808 isoform X5 n=1 Tax=Triplophysa rosa TaxID=992332 RepID=UPI002545CF21|nr:uncharacterized protein LOC130549808 isoform X5 [Triplophysa rosa]